MSTPYCLRFLFALVLAIYLSPSCTVQETQNEQLIASFDYGLTIARQAVPFSDTSVGNPTTWLWSFGNGTTSSEQNPSITYSQVGLYVVTLTVETGSMKSSTNRTITVYDPAVINAASVAFEDVSAAIASAKPGDTVLVPAGMATWEHQLVVDKGISLIGAQDGNTHIISGYSSPGRNTNADYSLIVYRPSLPELDIPFRLSGFSVDCSNRCCGISLINGNGGNPQTRVRIDHNVVRNTGNYGAFVMYGPFYGVADNNELRGAIVITVFSLDNAMWSHYTYKMGTSKNFFFEENTIFATTTVINSGWGGRYCFRYNIVNSEDHLFPCFDAHGNMGPGMGYALMGSEVYENIINSTSFMMIFFFHRGGRAAVFSNIVNSNSSVGIRIQEEYKDSGNPTAYGSRASDGEPQYPSEGYYWANYVNGITQISPTVAGTLDYGLQIGVVPEENKEYWVQKTPFDGTVGVGVGPLAERPHEGVPGVGYWANDLKKLFRWTNGQWEEYYVPFVYPHPLRAEFSRSLTN